MCYFKCKATLWLEVRGLSQKAMANDRTGALLQVNFYLIPQFEVLFHPLYSVSLRDSHHYQSPNLPFSLYSTALHCTAGPFSRLQSPRLSSPCLGPAPSRPLPGKERRAGASRDHWASTIPRVRAEQTRKRGRPLKGALCLEAESRLRSDTPRRLPRTSRRA